MDADPVIIRLAKQSDAKAIPGMARELAAAVQDPPPNVDLARFIEDAWGRERWCDCFIAKLDGLPVAYALVSRGLEAHTGQRRLWLGDLYVRSEARRRSRGRALMRAVARHAIRLGCTAVVWELWRKNAVDKAFYQALAANMADNIDVFRLGVEQLADVAREADN